MSAGDNRFFVFSDFDGTITAIESLQAVFEYFLPGEWGPVKRKLRTGETTLREGVPQLIESIPSGRYPEILQFVSEIPIRPGFEEFLTFLNDRDIPLVIVSGGIRGMVDIKLKKYMDRVYDIVAVDVDTSGDYLKVDYRYAGGDELVDKKKAVEKYGEKTRIVIGDGITDFNLAQHADLVFARDSLARFLDDKKFTYRKWGDFLDVKNQLRDWLTG